MISDAVPHARVIIGLGKTGFSCARYLTTQKIPFAMVDTREAPPAMAEFQREFPGVDIYCGELTDQKLASCEELIVSPGVALDEPAIQYAAQMGANIIGDIDLFCNAVSQPIIAITGSNAKSTVTTLVGEMCKAAGKSVGVGGNLGIPALDLIDDSHDLYVLELSSFQLERLQTLKADVAAILNISPDHLDRYQDVEAYGQAKQRIFNRAKQVVFNRSDLLTFPLVGLPLVGSAVAQWSFGLNSAEANDFGLIEHAEEFYLAWGDKPLLAASELKIKGSHNVENALAALAIGAAAGLPMNAMIETLKEFQGLPHRCQWIADIDGVAFYNDSKGTNVGAAIAAINGLATGLKNIILIAGGEGKGADFSEFGNVIAQHAKAAVLIGRDAGQIATAIDGRIDIRLAASLDAAVQVAKNLAVTGDIVLLSPACASFDMFNGFEHRGTCFIKAVEALK